MHIPIAPSCKMLHTSSNSSLSYYLDRHSLTDRHIHAPLLSCASKYLVRTAHPAPSEGPAPSVEESVC